MALINEIEKLDEKERQQLFNDFIKLLNKKVNFIQSQKELYVLRVKFLLMNAMVLMKMAV